MRAPRLPSLNDLTSFAQLFEFRTVSRWVLLGLLVGSVSGVAAVLVYVAIESVRHLVLEHGAHAPQLVPRGEPNLFGPAAPGYPRAWLLVFAPALGGLLSSIVIHLTRQQDSPQGHDGLIRAFHRGDGSLGLKGPLSRALAAVAIIGTGGSAGREGPVAYLGAALGSTLSDLLGLSQRERRLLLLAGAAAGIAAIFRSPLGAALFVLEVLYRDDFEADAIVPTVLSAVTGYSVFTVLLGETAMFEVADHYEFTPLQLPFYLIMAFGEAAVGVGFIKLLHWSRDRVFAPLPFPPLLKPMLGGLLVGCLALGVPQALGAGYGWLQEALLPSSSRLDGGWIGALVLLGIALAKVLTSTLTLSSGGSGGVFGPSVVIGGMVGGAFGLAFHQLAPALVPQPGAFVLVGMACFLGGVANAPISTLVMASEMTGSYDLLVPVMLAEVVTFALSRKTPLYESQVLSRRESKAHGGEYVMDLLSDVQVEDVIEASEPITPVRPDTPVSQLLEQAAGTNQVIFPMANAQGHLSGLVSLDTLRATFLDEALQRFAIAADCVGPMVALSPKDTLALALERFSASHYPQLPVIHPSNPDTVLGLISYEQLLTAYSSEMLRRRLNVNEPG